MAKDLYRPRLTQADKPFIEKYLSLKESGGNTDTLLTDNDTIPNDYNKQSFVLSAWNKEGYMMDINEYCEHYSLPRESITSYKLVSHTGTPFYNIVFKEQVGDETDLENIRDIIDEERQRSYTYQNKPYKKGREAVLKWSDLHFGSHIRNLVLTQDYDSSILYKWLCDTVYETNTLAFKKVHVHINGDLIESFSGLNHINSWQSMNKNEIGANAVMHCCDMLSKVLERIDNLGSIKIVAGNHDRLSKANDEDVKGGAAELIAWGLKKDGFEVEFHPYIITHKVEGINHINLHGHCGISKQSTSDIIWKYGEKGVFNFVFEGHLHNLMETASATKKDKIKLVVDDGIDYRRMRLQSLFPGNYYSETLGYTSNPGYMVIWDKGNKKPQVFNGTI